MTRLIFILAIFFMLPSLGFGADAASSVSKQITLSVDADLISFVKITIWLGSGFLVIFAVLGITFFGWDVRKARGSIIDSQKELSDLLKELRKDHEELKELKGKLGELGAKLQEDIESLQDLKEKREKLGAKPQDGTITPVSSAGSATPSGVGALTAVGSVLAASSANISGESAITAVGSVSGARSKLELIREVIASSDYEWTTIGRITKKTGLTRDEILMEASLAPDIKISYGRQTKDNMFKIDLNKSVWRPTILDIYPLPESGEAIEHGCKCTIVKNADGSPKLDQDRKLLYVIEKGCPIHDN